MEKKDSIQPTLGSASVVICCIGASEKEISDITGPYRIDYLATKNLVEAATSAKVNNFILVTSLGTNKFGFPAAILNLFWGVLCWKRKAEEALIASGLNYAIVRPGGMERPTDTYKETHNLTLSLDDTLFGGQVSNLQVAELLACMAKNPQLSFSKIVEVIAETTAPLTPTEMLLEKIPSKRPYMPPAKASVAAKEVTPVPTKPITHEPTAPKEDEAPPKEKDVKPRPLSPYAAYENLKPPTSPIPTSAASISPTISKEVDVVPVSETISNVPVEEEVKQAMEEEVKQAEEKKERPLSPYASYENLKPPSSPSPKASNTSKNDSLLPGPTDSDSDKSSTVPTSITDTPAPNVTDTAAPSVPETAETSVADTTAPSVTDTAVPATPRMRPLSPYAVYADLKPPTSPTPASTGPKETSSAKDNSELTEGNNDTLKTVDGSVDTTLSTYIPEAVPVVSNVIDTSTASEDIKAHQKPRPLSPYTMYEDMKPPTSPLPSPLTNN